MSADTPFGTLTRAPVAGGLVEALLAEGFGFFTGVADSGFKRLIVELEAAELGGRYVLATREDNAVALAVGAQLAGRRPLVFMESSGFGNILDAVTSLAIAFEIPLVLYVAWAGYQGRDVPHHNAIGEPLEGILDCLGLETVRVGLDDPPPVIARAAGQAMRQAGARSRPVVLLGIPPGLAAETGGE